MPSFAHRICHFGKKMPSFAHRICHLGKRMLSDARSDAYIFRKISFGKVGNGVDFSLLPVDENLLSIKPIIRLPDFDFLREINWFNAKKQY